MYFYPRSPCGERLDAIDDLLLQGIFLSTLSLRRATPDGTVKDTFFWYFYPRSPCGERPYEYVKLCQKYGISIHALLAESDHNAHPETRRPCVISIHALLAESDLRPPALINLITRISIHALLAESDAFLPADRMSHQEFLSTLSLRSAPLQKYLSLSYYKISIHALLAESDNSQTRTTTQTTKFLSTLSLRRATGVMATPITPTYISIHALLAESDFPAL